MRAVLPVLLMALATLPAAWPLDRRTAGRNFVVLEVHGPGRICTYTRTRLELLGLRPVHLRNYVWPGLDGRYHGVPLPTILMDCGLDSAPAIVAHGMDGYTARIPRQDWERWPIWVVSRKNDRTIPLREKGPLLLLYQVDQDDTVGAVCASNRSTWMLQRIEQVPGSGG